MDKFNQGPPSLCVPHLSKWASAPPAEGSRGSGNDNTTRHKGLQRWHSASLSLTKTFTRKWGKSRRRKKCCCSSLKTRLRGGKSRLGRLVFSSVHMNKQSQCGIETWRMTHREIRGTICLILEQHRGSTWRLPIRMETKQVALRIFGGREKWAEIYIVFHMRCQRINKKRRIMQTERENWCNSSRAWNKLCIRINRNSNVSNINTTGNQN